MYSGHVLLYGIKLKYIDAVNILDIDDDDEDCLDYVFDDNKIKNIQFLTLPCCYYKESNEVFIAINLGTLKSLY